MISHLNNPNKLINDQMTEYYQKTKNSHFYVRDTRLGEASRELERKVTKLLRTNRQLNTISAYRSELEAKREYYNYIKKEYPEIGFSEHDIHSYTIEQMKKKISNNLEYARIIGAVLRIQRAWRRFIQKRNRWYIVQERISATLKI